MAGKPLEDATKPQKQEIKDKQDSFVEFLEKVGVERVAADWIGRDMETIRRWKSTDEVDEHGTKVLTEFGLRVSAAKATFIKNNQRRIKLDNVFANLYAEYKPPKQEIDATIAGGFTFAYVTPDLTPANPDHLPADPETTPGVAIPDRPNDE